MLSSRVLSPLRICTDCRTTRAFWIAQPIFSADDPACRNLSRFVSRCATTCLRRWDNLSAVSFSSEADSTPPDRIRRLCLPVWPRACPSLLRIHFRECEIQLEFRLRNQSRTDLHRSTERHRPPPAMSRTRQCHYPFVVRGHAGKPFVWRTCCTRFSVQVLPLPVR